MNAATSTALTALLCALALAFSGAAHAGPSASVAVSAGIAGTCNFSSQAAGQQLIFTNATGGIDTTLGTNATASTTITYQCSSGQSPSFTFAGANDGGGNHHLVNGTSSIVYTTSFTSGGAGSGFGTGTTKTLTLNGTITPTQYSGAAPATYTDTLTVTVNP